MSLTKLSRTGIIKLFPLSSVSDIPAEDGNVADLFLTVFKFLATLIKKKINGNFLLASLKTFTILNIVPEAASEFHSTFSSLPFVEFRHCFSDNW
jgi:hypothetical protein